MFFLHSKSNFPSQTQTKKGKINWTFFDIAFWFGFFLTMPIFTYTTLSAIFSTFSPYLFTSVEVNHHPTSLSWVKSKNDCEKFGRNWEDNKCWDNEHSPMF